MKRIREHDPVKAKQLRERARKDEAARIERERQAAAHRERRERGEVPGLLKKGDQG